MCRHYGLLFIIAFACVADLMALPGKVLLRNGISIKGDIQKNADGSCWVTQKTCSVKYDAQEISRITIYSAKEPMTDRFVSSMKITGSDARHPAGAPTRYDGIITRAARENNLDPRLVKAVINAESGFNPNDRSAKGACGLMQLMPTTARMLGVKNIYSPEENIAAGTKFLKYMLVQFDGNLPLALAAYNAGPSVVQRYRCVPPYKETCAYVDRVSRYYRTYRKGSTIRSYVDQSGCLTLYNVR